jgi:Pyruvate/2-oxoacid:ferredoxin oxidoreductase delta subunit/flavodoxin
MKTIIYYFSATGNSLVLARKIGTGLGNTELVAIPQALHGTINTDVERIGLVFPVYAWGMPRIVLDFVKRLKLQKDQYVFAVATCGAVPGGTLKKLGKLVRKNGGRLAAGFAVKEAAYALLGGGNPLMKLIAKIAKPISRNGAERLPEILTAVQNNQSHRPEISSALINLIATSFYGMALQFFKTADKAFWVNDACTGCQVCARLCPRNNIEIVAGRPTWKHDCELCFGCVQWCPNAAIQYQEGSVGKPRSHNPGVTLDDVLLR